MTSPARSYQQEMHSNLGFFTTWLPGDDIAVGDVGLLEDGRLRRVTSLESLHIPYETKEGTSRRDLQYTSTRGTKIAVDAGASVSGVAKGKITLEFSENGAFVFHVHGLREERLADLRTAAAGVIDAYKSRRWEKDWVMVESVHTAEVATIVISQDSSASLELEAAADGAITTLALADPKVRLSVKSARGKLVHLVGGENTRPLYLCARIKHSLFGAPKVEPARGVSSGPDLLELMERPALDDLVGEKG
jgi:hypothetical protein